MYDGKSWDGELWNSNVQKAVLSDGARLYKMLLIKKSCYLVAYYWHKSVHSNKKCWEP